MSDNRAPHEIQYGWAIFLWRNIENIAALLLEHDYDGALHSLYVLTCFLPADVREELRDEIEYIKRLKEIFSKINNRLVMHETTVFESSVSAYRINVFKATLAYKVFEPIISRLSEVLDKRGYLEREALPPRAFDTGSPFYNEGGRSIVRRPRRKD